MVCDATLRNGVKASTHSLSYPSPVNVTDPNHTTYHPCKTLEVPDSLSIIKPITNLTMSPYVGFHLNALSR